MTELEYGIVFGALGAVGAIMGTLLKLMWNSFNEHKKSVQYKDNCEQHVQAIKDSQAASEKLFDTKLNNIESTLKDLVVEVKRVNGTSKPKIQT